MLAMTIVGIVIAILVLLALYSLLKNVFHFALSAAGIIIVVYLVIAGLRYADKRDLRDNLLVSNNLILVEDSGTIISGFATQGTPLPEDIDYKDRSLQDDFYKVIVIPKDGLKDMDAQSYFNQLIGDNPVENLIQKERSGDIKVFDESIAFRRGLEVFGL